MGLSRKAVKLYDFVNKLKRKKIGENRKIVRK
jgi:hypothetical protein